jgi:ABC-type methionine transport system ATPase subunit
VAPVVRTVKLFYPAALVTEPVLYRLCREFEIVPNIRKARVTDASGELTVKLKGEAAEVARGIAFLTALGISVQELGAAPAPE